MANDTDVEFCATCRFWAQIISDDDAELFGKCRRTHPQIIDQLLKDCEDICSATQFPQTSGEEWCGEYEAGASNETGDA